MGDDAENTERKSARDALTLLELPRVGVREWHKRVALHGSPSAALRMLPPTPELDAARLHADATLLRANELGVRALVLGSDSYPAPLLDLSDADAADLTPAPPVIFAIGNLDLLTRPSVAIVGTRHATATGLRVAERIAQQCVESGISVVSGLARGVDAAAHTGALHAGGATVAVIGTGIDINYPADHRALQQQIATRGLVLTERAPGQRATRGSFPERNRLIAALAGVTLVVEAGHRSGALLTARAAASLNRKVAAVPGSFDAASCLGSNALLRDGAHVIASTDDLFALVGVWRGVDRDASPPASMTEAERAVWDVLGPSPLELDLVMERTGWAADACLAAVTTLELRGLVRATHAGALLRA
jgi:DNA processing protein